jgi:PAS domain S-box-containing protein
MFSLSTGWQPGCTPSARGGIVRFVTLGLSGALPQRSVVASTGAAAAIVLGLVGLLGQAKALPWLGSVGLALNPMAPLTAAGLVAIGAATFLAIRRSSSVGLVTVALLVVAVACGRLVAFRAGLSESPGSPLDAGAGGLSRFLLGHISPLSTVAFLLAGAALASLGLGSARRIVGDTGGVLAFLLTLLSLVVLLGYAFGTPFLYGGSVVPMAPTAAVAFVGLGTALIALSGPDRLPLRPVSGPSVEAQLLRGFLPILLAVIVAECFLFRFNPGLNPALRAALASLILAAVVLVGGLRLARRVGGVVDAAEAELRQSEERLRDSEELFRNAFEHAMEGVCLVGPDGRFLRANPALCGMLGYSSEELKGRLFNDVTHSDDKGIGSDFLARALAGGTDRGRFEKRYLRKDGGVVWAEVATTLVRPAGGRPCYFITLLQDVSERRHAERSLAASEALLRQFIKHTPAAVAMFDTEMRYLQASDRWLTDYHLEGREIIGRSHYEVFPDVPDRWKEVHRRVLAGAVEQCMEDEFPRADGTMEWLQWEARPWFKSDGTIGGLGMFTQVVTGRKQAEEERVRLGMAIEQSAEAVMITDPHGAIVYVNPAFVQITGYSRDEIIGQNPRLLKSGRQDPAFYRRMWATLLRGETWTGRITNRRKDGTPLEEDAVISPVRDASGRLVNYVAVKRDITHEKSLEEQLAQAQKMEAVGRLAGGVAHDFNNILGVILGYGETVERRLPAGDPLRDKVKQIVRAAGRAADLTRQLLAFSRKQVLRPRALDLNEVVSGMDKMLRRLIGEDVALATRLGPHLGAVRADPGQIEQVLMNLAVNARDAMPDGGHLTIETANANVDRMFTGSRSRLPPGRYVLLSVADDGIGMSPETEARIFEPFFTTKQPGKGTGLGLSTVYGIVKQSEGYIWVYSELGKGTTFKVYLPRIDEEVVAEAETAALAAPRGTETLLLVEDEPALRDLVREVLVDSGYTVLTAGDGPQALAVARAHAGPIEVLVTDVVMPGMTGPKLAEQIALERPDAKVIYLSGYSEEAVVTLGQLGPGTILLTKPFAGGDLLRAIRSVVAGGGAG